MPWSSEQVCEDCWKKEQPLRDPIRLREQFRETEPCCKCGMTTRSGIYVRHYTKPPSG
jgi:hypothetical protein